MTLSSSQAVGGVSQGSYTPQPEPVVSPVSDVTSKVTEKTSLKPEEKDRESSQSGEASKEAIKKAVSDINKRSNGTEAIFGIHDDTNRVTIKIVDKTSRDVIKEYPAEKTLDLISKAWELAGIMVDEKR